MKVVWKTFRAVQIQFKTQFKTNFMRKLWKTFLITFKLSFEVFSEDFTDSFFWATVKKTLAEWCFMNLVNSNSTRISWKTNQQWYEFEFWQQKKFSCIWNTVREVAEQETVFLNLKKFVELKKFSRSLRTRKNVFQAEKYFSSSRKKV